MGVRPICVRRISASVLLILLLPAVAIGQEAAPRRAIDLVTEDSIRIDRPAAGVWPFILDDSAWKKAVKATHVSGPARQVGEVFAASVPTAGPDTLYYMKTVDLETNRRLTLKLFNVKEGPLIGYASFALEEDAGKTRVTYRVFAELPVTESQDPAQTQLRAVKDNQARFRAELHELKRLAESQAKGRGP